MQNIFNKYGEETFIVEVIEYVKMENIQITKPVLRDLETKYQNIYRKYCINFDRHTKSWAENATEEQKMKNRKQLDNIRKLAIKVCEKPLIVFDILKRMVIHVNSISEAERYVESKHIRINIHDKRYILYRNRYVCFLPDEFDPDKIIYTINGPSSKSNYIEIYNLYTKRYTRLSSASEAANFLFNHPKNLKSVYSYFNIIDSRYYTLKNITTLDELYSTNFKISRSFSLDVSFKKVYELLKSGKNITRTSIFKYLGICVKKEHTIFAIKSPKQILEEFEQIIASVQNPFIIGNPILGINYNNIE